jgi:hypothetical protein
MNWRGEPRYLLVNALRPSEVRQHAQLGELQYASVKSSLPGRPASQEALVWQMPHRTPWHLYGHFSRNHLESQAMTYAIIMG